MEAFINSPVLWSLITLISYFIGLIVFKSFTYTWLNPLYTVTILVIGFLSIFHVDIKTYLQGVEIFSFLLGTATVSLAIPLYKQLGILKKHLAIILGGVSLGTITGVASVALLAKGLHLNHELYASLVPKSVTLPIATSVSSTLGGAPSLTVLFVIISALFSLITGPLILSKIGIKSKLAKGLALGTSAQALGANRALQWGELEGAVGSVAMSTAAIFAAIVIPLIGPYLLL